MYRTATDSLETNKHLRNETKSELVAQLSVSVVGPSIPILSILNSVDAIVVVTIIIIGGVECVVRAPSPCCRFASSFCSIFGGNIARASTRPRAPSPVTKFIVLVRLSVLCVYMPFNSFNNLSNMLQLKMEMVDYSVDNATEWWKQTIAINTRYVRSSTLYNAQLHGCIFVYLIRNEWTVSVEHLLLSFHCLLLHFSWNHIGICLFQNSLRLQL